MKTFDNVLEGYAQQEGWTNKTQLHLLLGFLAENEGSTVTPEKLEDNLEELVQMEEAQMLEEQQELEEDEDYEEDY